MNDSPYGLTASVWTKADSNSESEEAFLRIVDELETGTVFLNRFVVPIAQGRYSQLPTDVITLILPSRGLVSRTADGASA